MISDRFRELVEQNLGCAVILAGSDSDQPHIEKIAASLRGYEIPHEVRIISAHKQPMTLEEARNIYDALNGSLVYIAVAGGTDALSGTLSYRSFRPTISCPPDGINMSCLTNPPGSSNAFIARPENVGRFVAQIFSSLNPRYRESLIRKATTKFESLLDADQRLQSALSWHGDCDKK